MSHVIDSSKDYSLPENSKYYVKPEFRERQAKLDYFNSEEFKQAEKARIERSQVEEHVGMGKGRVWCPVERKNQPEWLCALHHGDRDPSFDVDQEDWSGGE